MIFVERSGRPIAQRTATSVASAPTINNRRPVNLCLSNCFPMSNWYRRRAAYRVIVEADAKALIERFGDQAYSEARKRQHYLLDGDYVNRPEHHWERVKVAIRRIERQR